MKRILVVLLFCCVHVVSAALRVVFAAAGHGDAALITTPAGKQLLVDCAGRQFAGHGLCPFLRGHGVRMLDVLVLTHPHDDHIGGAPTLLATFTVRRIFEPGHACTSATYRQLLGIAAKKSVPLSFPHAGMVLYREPRLSMTVLSPPARLFYHTKSDANNNSLVILLRHGATSILFTGDAEQAALVRLFHSYPALRCTLVKVPHHGSVTGLVPGMYSRLAPRAAVITGGPAGAPPAPAVLAALSAARVRVYRTDREGALTVRGDGRRLTVSARYAPCWP